MQSIKKTTQNSVGLVVTNDLINRFLMNIKRICYSNINEMRGFHQSTYIITQYCLLTISKIQHLSVMQKYVVLENKLQNRFYIFEVHLCYFLNLIPIHDQFHTKRKIVKTDIIQNDLHIHFVYFGKVWNYKKYNCLPVCFSEVAHLIDVLY